MSSWLLNPEVPESSAITRSACLPSGESGCHQVHTLLGRSHLGGYGSRLNHEGKRIRKATEPDGVAERRYHGL
jgi:hypothetical protein